MGICTGAYLDNANLNFRVLPKGLSPALFDSGLVLDANSLFLENALTIVSDDCLPPFFLGGKEQVVM